MESNVMFSGFSPRMLSLEMPQNPQNPQNPVQFQHPHPHPYAAVADQQQHHQTQPPMKQPLYPYASAKPKQLSPISGGGGGGDDEDRGSGSGSGCNPEESGGVEEKRKFSQWHRMKWTDTMVRLLIMAVFYIGDEAGVGDHPIDAKKKTGGGAGMLQKKGKWKSVSRAMVEKGFSVSPQQCEDKFNDLNKRYKRVNDILGKGIACRVVENQGLLESMDHLTPKLKDEVKKLLNSKHLFFREMCAYHNSCGHLGGAHTEQSQPQPQQPSQTQTQTQTQDCFHAAESGKMARIAESDEEEESAMAEDSESEDTEDSDEEETKKKKRRKGEESVISPSVKRLREEAARVLDDVGKSAWEKKEWMKRKKLEIEERKVGYEWEGVEMEKQRVKWMRYRSKKEREMDKAKLENQRRMLETERMVLILRRREIELAELQSSSGQKTG